jgi:hypothetical protein
MVLQASRPAMIVSTILVYHSALRMMIPFDMIDTLKQFYACRTGALYRSGRHPD